jgi:murein DD-endopeptidase MepM/ murein hydrolase activator NlpD
VARHSLDFLFTRFVCLLLAWVSIAVSLPAFAATNWAVQAQPARLVNGGPVLFKVRPPRPVTSLSGRWLGHDVTFSYDASSKMWFALAGISLETAHGPYPLELTGESDVEKNGAKKLSFAKQFGITVGKYPRIKAALSVDTKFTEPTPEQQKEIEESQEVKKDYLNRMTPEREWSGSFAEPADAAISDVFGSERVFNNGKTSSPHLGLDFRVPSGTPVLAMNAGTVLLARPLYFEGNFVVLDHGQGLLTLYLHLSEFKVKEGEQVKRGQVVGLSGGTGRATGPHLHVAVRWQGTYLDPAGLLRLKLP